MPPTSALRGRWLGVRRRGRDRPRRAEVSGTGQDGATRGLPNRPNGESWGGVAPRFPLASGGVLDARGETMDEILLNNLRDCLADLADEQKLRDAWVTVAFFFSDYDDLMCMIFDDTGLCDIIDSGTLEAEFGPRASALIGRLHRLTKELGYDLRGESLLEHPTFKEMQQTARELLAELRS